MNVRFNFPISPFTACSIIAWLLASGLGCLGQGTFTTTFDGPPRQPPGTARLISEYLESGVAVSVTNQPAEPGEFFILSGGGMSGQPENGTAYIQSQPSGVMFRFMDNSLFGISAMDIAAYSDVLPDISLIVLGYRWDGTILNTTFGGTGIEWRTVNFDAQWASGLARVEFLGFSGAYDPNWSVDNIQLSVPEPSCGMLLILGLSAFLLKKKRC